jgi:hypothetical protein
MRTGARLGLYPSIYDSFGQYPPLYVTPHAADFITYFDIEYGKKPLRFRKPGIVDPGDMGRHDPHKVKWNIHTPKNLSSFPVS